MSMARFDRLPPEVYRTIIERLEPDDVVSFSFVCRKLYLLSKDRIVRHVELQDIYSEIRIDQDHHPLTLLYAIRKNPEIAFYIKHVEWHGVEDPLKVLPAGPLTVGHTKETIPVGPWLPDDIRTFMPDLRAGLHHGGPYVIAWSQFRQQLSEGNVNACFLLLLFHLPRLVRLRFSCPTFDAHFWHRMFSAWDDTFNPALVEKNPMLANGRSPAADSPYPHRLSPPTLQIVEALDDESDPNRLAFSPLTAFTALSSVRAIRVKDATQIYRPYSLAWQTEPTVWSTFRGGVEDISDCGSISGDDEEAEMSLDDDDESAEPLTNQAQVPFNIRTIEITDSDIPAQTFAELLPHCPHLTSFKMSYGSFDGIGSSQWHDLPCVVESLERLFSNTLTHLSLVHPFDYGSTPQIKSFKSFTSLKWLEISLATLLPQDTWREKEAWLMRSAGDVPRLIDVLPESLEELVIGTEISPQALSKSRLLAGWPLVTSPTLGKRPLASTSDDPTSPVTRLLGSRSAFDYFQPSTDGKSTTDCSRNGSVVIESGHHWRQDLAAQATSLGLSAEVVQDNKRKSMTGEWERAWARQRGDGSSDGAGDGSRKDSLESIEWQPYSMSPPAAKRARTDTQGPSVIANHSNAGVEHEYPAMAEALNFLFPEAESRPIVHSTYNAVLGTPQGWPHPQRRERQLEHDPNYQPLPAMSRLSIDEFETPTPKAPQQPALLFGLIHDKSAVSEQQSPLAPPGARLSIPSPSASPSVQSQRPLGLKHRLGRISYFCCSTTSPGPCDCLDAATRLAIDNGIFAGLEIRRKIHDGGWAPDHEDSWASSRGSCCGSGAGGWSGEDAAASNSGSGIGMAG